MAFREAIEKEIRRNRSLVLSRQGAHVRATAKTEALAAFRRALALQPEHHDATYAAAQSLAALGRYDEASVLVTSG